MVVRPPCSFFCVVAVRCCLLLIHGGPGVYVYMRVLTVLFLLFDFPHTDYTVRSGRVHVHRRCRSLTHVRPSIPPVRPSVPVRVSGLSEPRCLGAKVLATSTQMPLRLGRILRE